MKHATLFRNLWTMLEEGGFCSLRGHIPPATCWSRMRDVLDAEVHRGDRPGIGYADLTWMPDSTETPEEIMARVASAWPTADVSPQVWIVGFVDEVPRARQGRVRMVVQGDHHDVEVDIDAHQRSVIGRRGPHLVLVQATQRPQGGIGYDKLAAQAVLSPTCPVPVDSSYERDVIRLVQELGLSYHKPCFAHVPGLTPDLMLLDMQVIVEVQGMQRDGYDERKAAVHARMREHPAFRGWRLVAYDPRIGETLRDLRRKVREGWRGRTVAAPC